MTVRAVGERGSFSIEAAVIAPGILLFFALALFAGRTVGAEQDVRRAASAAARAAAAVNYAEGAEGRAAEIASANLEEGQSRCVDATVTVEVENFFPGGIVAVTVTCEASLASLGLLGIGGTREFSARSVASIDRFRGG